MPKKSKLETVGYVVIPPDNKVAYFFNRRYKAKDTADRMAKIIIGVFDRVKWTEQDKRKLRKNFKILKLRG